MFLLDAHYAHATGGGPDVVVCDDAGQGGAHHSYAIVKTAAVAPDGDVGYFLEDLLGRVEFQNGPIQEVGVNGVQLEHLLAIGQHRLECFQAGPFASKYNAEALEHIKLALASLHRRTIDRVAREVEGLNKQ